MNFENRNNYDQLLERSIYCVGNSKYKISYLGGAKTKNLKLRIDQELGKKNGFYGPSSACKDIKPDILYWTFNIPFKCSLKTQEDFEIYLKNCWERDGKQNFVINGLEARHYTKKIKPKINQIKNKIDKDLVLEKVIIE